MSSGDMVLVALIAAIALCVVMKRITRSINISKHGWPPPHLDADGDAIDYCECEVDEREAAPPPKDG